MSVLLFIPENYPKILHSAPTSGGQYHWVAMLAPRGSEKLLSYVSGTYLAPLQEFAVQ